MASDKISDPNTIYQQSVDKQRIVIAGAQSHITAHLILYILDFFKREFDFVVATAPTFATSNSRITGASVIIVQESDKPSSALPGYHHHIGVLGDISPADEPGAIAFADATPKGGIFFYSDRETAAKVGKRERPDVTSIPFQPCPHTVEKGQVILVSSTKEKVPIKFSGDQNLRSASVAKEVLKKLGITSGQFYRAVATFEV